MQKILVIGAGRSATALIHYLLEKSVIYDWKITVADHDLNMAIAKVNQHPNGNAIQFEVEDKSLSHRWFVIQSIFYSFWYFFRS